MSGAPTASAPGAVSIKPQPGGQNSSIKKESQNGTSTSPQVNWESEIQLVASLAKLQELERQVRAGNLLRPCEVLLLQSVESTMSQPFTASSAELTIPDPCLAPVLARWGSGATSPYFKFQSITSETSCRDAIAASW